MGSFETMVVLLVLISSVTSVIKQRQKTSRKDLALLVDEVRALKDEVRQLRSQNNDVVLALDHTVHRIDRASPTSKPAPASAPARSGASPPGNRGAAGT